MTNEAAQVPLLEQLRSVPKDWREMREVGYCAHRNVPYGRMLHEAADEIERLQAGGCARDQNTTQFCAEAVALQKDAERYRWLRDLPWVCELNQFSGPQNRQYLWSARFSSPRHDGNSTLDDAVDDARHHFGEIGDWI